MLPERPFLLDYVKTPAFKKTTNNRVAKNKNIAIGKKMEKIYSKNELINNLVSCRSSVGTI